MQENIYILRNEQESISFAKMIASHLRPSDIVLFYGDLGLGKTFLCREIIRYLCKEDLNVSSPTFNLLQIYQAKECKIYHYDCYRMRYPEEIYELAIEDALSMNIILIEWPEIVENILPKSVIKIKLSAQDETRICVIDANYNNRFNVCLGVLNKL